MKRLLLSTILLFSVSAHAAVELDSDGNDAVDLTIGGTNATSAAGARTNLDVYSKAESDALSGAGTVTVNGTPVDNDWARFTDADTIEGRSDAEIKSDLDLEAGTDFYSITAADSAFEDDLGNPGSNDYVLSSQTDGTRSWVENATGTGDVSGPSSATDLAYSLFDGTGGKTIMNSLTTEDSSGNITVTGTTTSDGFSSTAADTYRQLTFTENTANTNVNSMSLHYTADELLWQDEGGTDREIVISSAFPVELCVAASDETTDLTTGTAKVTFRSPWAFTLTAVRCSVNTAPTGSATTVDVNEGGTTVISTKLTIDATEETSTTAATPAVISDSAIADDAELTIDIDAIGSGSAAKGLKVCLYGTRSF